MLTAWPPLRTWISDDRAALCAHQQLTAAARAWAAEGKDRHLLYRGARLAAALDLMPQRRVGPQEQEFIRASVGFQDADRRAERARARRLRTQRGSDCTEPAGRRSGLDRGGQGSHRT
ncbi:hypothetical protein [Streptomyces sp. NPDC053069]|uniref:nSTAND1 domain-containing NTPase n=1 Tax=Streptomyces sp. NPDC053069 TaxID=3365695 RepID=UPI0037CE4D4E